MLEPVPEGDILIFLTGQEQVDTAVRALDAAAMRLRATDEGREANRRVEVVLDR